MDPHIWLQVLLILSYPNLGLELLHCSFQFYDSSAFISNPLPEIAVVPSDDELEGISASTKRCKKPQAPAFFRLFRAEGVHRSLRSHPITGNHIFHLTNLNLLKNNRLRGFSEGFQFLEKSVRCDFLGPSANRNAIP